MIDLEKVVQEEHDDYGTYCLTEDTCKDILRQIIPKPLECAINLAMVGIPDKDVTYQRLKDIILEYALDNEGKAPMKVSAVEQSTESSEGVASVGAPKGLGAGKGAGANAAAKTGKGTGTGNNNSSGKKQWMPNLLEQGPRGPRLPILEAAGRKKRTRQRQERQRQRKR